MCNKIDMSGYSLTPESLYKALKELPSKYKEASKKMANCFVCGDEHPINNAFRILFYKRQWLCHACVLKDIKAEFASKKNSEI